MAKLENTGKTVEHSFVENLAAPINQFVETAVDTAKENLDNLVGGSEDLYYAAVDRATGTYRLVEKVVNKGLKQGTKMVKKHPLEAALIGVGVGCLIGLLYSRRR